MRRPETPRQTLWWSIGRVAVLAAFTTLFLVASSQEAQAQISIADQAVAVTTGRQTSLTFNHNVSNVSDRLLFVSMALAKQSGTLTGVQVFYDPDGVAGPLPEVLLDDVVGTFYEGNNDNALRGIHMFYQVAPTATPVGFTGRVRVTNTNPQGLHMAGFAYTLAGVNGMSPFNTVCTDVLPAGTPNAACTVGTAANGNGFVIDTIVMVATAAISSETPTPKGGTSNQGAPTPRFRTSLDSGGQDMDATSGAYSNTSTNPFSTTGYAHDAGNAFLFVSVGFTPANVTAAEVSHFDATRYTETMRGQPTDRGVMLRWRTSVESDNVGFHLYREDRGASRVRVTREIIAGSSLLTRTALLAGYSYAWWDSEGTEQSQYWLESIDMNGRTSLEGPFAPSVKEGAAPGEASSQTVDKVNAQALESRIVTGAPAGYGTPRGANAKGGGSTPPLGALETQWQVASRPAVKLSVVERGWYRVTQGELAALGIDTTTIDPRNLQLYADGSEIAIRVSGETDGRLDPGDAIEFFGSGLDTASTDTQVYWLAPGSTRGKRIRVDAASPSNGSPVTFPYAVEQKERSLYIGNVNNGDRENFFGRILFTTLDTNVRLDNVAGFGTTAQVSVGLQGFYQTPHQIEVSFNGQVLGTINGEGNTYASATFSVPHALLLEGNNVVTLRRAGSTIHLVDYIRVTYQRTSIATGNELLMSIPSRQPAVTVGGFTTPGIRVVDVTNPAAVQEFSPRVAGGDSNYTATVRGLLGRTYYAFGSDVVKQPVAMEIDQRSSWNLAANRADVVMISHADFIGELAALKALREAQGYTVAVVDVEDVYDEFGFGAHSAEAVKAFLMRTASWQTAPRYVLLVGDATYDPRNYIGIGDVDFVPTRLADTLSFQAAYDDWLADRNGDDVAELAVGRLPVRTAAEAQTVVSKILSYEAAPTGPISALFVADDPRGDDFVANSEALQALVPSSATIQQIYRPVAGAASRQQTLDAINSGKSLVHYSGHGSITIWSGNLLMDTDAQSLTNGDRLSVFTVSNCLNAYYHAAIGDSLGEALLKAPNGGAIAVWASSGTTPSKNQQPVAVDFYLYLFSSPNATVGEAAAYAKRTASLDVRQSWVLLGDPLTRLK